MRRVAVLLVLLLGCEKPRERACRALVMKADNAEAARAYLAPAPLLDAHRAASAARWVRTSAIEDPALSADADALADALERLADARRRLSDAREALAARDVTELVERSARVRTLASDLTQASAFAGADDATCRPEGPEPIAARAQLCASALEARPDAAAHAELVANLRTAAGWARALPSRASNETLARAAEGLAAIADRARAEADVTAAAAAVRARCAS